MDSVLTYLSKYDLPCVNLALFILWFDSMGTGFKNIFNKNLISSENISPYFFASRNYHAIPLFIDANILPISFLYFKSIS